MAERCTNLVSDGAPFWYQCGKPEGHRSACLPRSEEERHDEATAAGAIERFAALDLPGAAQPEETQHG
jgi:hypothetical protein